MKNQRSGRKLRKGKTLGKEKWERWWEGWEKDAMKHCTLDLLAEKQRESWDCMDSVCVLLSLCLRPSSTELPSPVERGGASMAGN